MGETDLKSSDTSSDLVEAAMLLTWWRQIRASVGGPRSGTERGIEVQGLSVQGLQIALKARVGVAGADNVLAQDVGGRDGESSWRHRG
jgi:hypothetical protein